MSSGSSSISIIPATDKTADAWNLKNLLLLVTIQSISNPSQRKCSFTCNYFLQNDVLKTKAWKARQVQPRMPEESDDTETRAVYDAYTAQQRLATNIEHL